MGSSRAFLVFGSLAVLALLVILWPFGASSPPARAGDVAHPAPDLTVPVRPVDPGPELVVAGPAQSSLQARPTVETASVRRDTPQPSVRGRCLSAQEAEPLPGITVHLVVWGQEPLAAVTDAHGDFEFPSPGNTVTWAEVRRPSNWVHGRARLRLTPEQRVGEDKVLFALEEAATVVGRVVDAATGEPVPWVSVKLAENEGFSDSIDVGVDGTFLSAGRLRQRQITASVRDRGGYMPLTNSDESSVRVSWDPGTATPLELIAAVGPTYYLLARADGPLASRTLRARVVQTARDGREVSWPWKRLRDEGGTPWLRYTQRPANAFSDGSARIEVRTTQSTWGGSTDVDTTVGVHPGVVEVQMRTSGRLRGRIADESGQPVDGARVHIAPLSAGRPDRDPARWTVAQSERRGDFTLEPVFPGRYRLVVDVDGAPPLERDLEVSPGPTELGTLVVAREPGELVWGALTFDQSAGPLQAYLRLVPNGRGARARSIQPSLEHEEERVFGVFEFSDVPEGSYELEVVSTDHFQWTPERVTVSPSDDPLTFERVESASGYSAGFRPVDASGRPISDFNVRLSVGPTWEPIGHPWAWGELRGPMPAGQQLQWTLSAAGYRPVHGTERDFVSEDSDSRRRFAGPELVEGWGARLHVRDASDFHASLRTDPWTYRAEALARPAIVGATILANGRPVGTTDATGRIDLSLEAAPDRLEVVREGWIALDSPFLRGGQLASGEREGIVWMQSERP